MSYKDLEEARAKREAKEKAIKTKGNRGSKRKSPAPEEAEAGPSVRKDKVVRMSEVEPANTLEGASWRIPVAKMH